MLGSSSGGARRIRGDQVRAPGLFLRMLRMARIAPETLKRRLDDGEDMTVIDLRARST